MEQDITDEYIVRSGCGGSSDRSLLVENYSACSLLTIAPNVV